MARGRLLSGALPPSTLVRVVDETAGDNNNTAADAVLYADASSGTTVANPVTTTAGGALPEVYVDEGSYTLVVGGGQFRGGSQQISAQAVPAAASASGTSVATVRRTTSQAIATDTAVAVSWETAEINESGLWTLDVPTRFTVPATVTGTVKARVSASVVWTYHASNRRFIRIKKNGVVIARVQAIASTDTQSSGPQSVLVSPIVNAVAGDYFEVEVYQSSGTSLNLDPAATNSGGVWATIEVGVGGVPF